MNEDTQTQTEHQTSKIKRWWKDEDLKRELRAEIQEVIIRRNVGAKMDRDIFAAIVEGWTRVTGVQPIYAQGSLYLYERAIGIWSLCPSPKAPSNGGASYRALWDLVRGLESAEKKIVRGGEEPVLIKIGPTQERRMDEEPLRSHEIHQPDVFDYETPGLILPTRLSCGKVEWRLWAPGDDGLVSHRRPEPQDYKRHFQLDRSLGDSQIIDADADVPEIPGWEDYLTTLWGDGDEAADKKQAIEEFLGAAMCSIATDFSRFAVFEGSSGSNGKSLFCRFITQHLFQKDQTCASPPEQWGPDSFGTIQLDNKLINVITEIAETKALRSDRLKAVISGDEVSANRKNMSHVLLRPKAAHVIACNRFPRLGDNSGGMARRLLMFRFDRSFHGVQRRSERELLRELHALVPLVRLRCLFAAADLMKRRDYTLSAEHHRELQELQERSSAVTGFVAQCIERNPEEIAGVLPKEEQAELYKAYREFCGATGVLYQVTDREFYKELEAAGFRRTPPGTGHRKFLAIKLRAKADWGCYTPEQLREPW